MYYTLHLLSIFPFVLIFLYLFLNFVVKGKKSVCVVVLGDIGRSPRMQYHAVSLAREGFTVDIVGYGGSDPHKQIREDDNIQVHFMREPPSFIKSLPRLVGYVVKVIYQSAVLAFTLLILPKSGYIFLQNSPAIPTIAVSWVVSLLRFSELVIDWHNYGYTILAMALRPSHPLVAFSKWYERFFGRFSTSNMCVTNAMKEDLNKNWGVKATTLYDRAPKRFEQTSLESKHSLFTRLGNEYEVFASDLSDSTVFTEAGAKSGVEERVPRPALVVSSTSWTEDEDFGILLKALEKYEEAASAPSATLPDLICVITGKGPQKEMYKEKISQMSFSHVKFCLPWLTSEDYPLLLGSADLGVCLHKSSSGLDLPMKVVDMFGCGLPVCAVQFDCLSELVQHGENGLVFQNSEELSEQLQDLLGGFPKDQSKLTKMRSKVKKFQSVRWHSQWKQLALPLFGVKLKTD